MSILAFSTFGNTNMKHGVTPVPRFSEWPEISTDVSTLAVDRYEYEQHQVQFTQKCGILPKDGAVQLSMQLQCKLAGDGPEVWAHFATKLKDCCGVVEHLGDLRASALA